MKKKIGTRIAEQPEFNCAVDENNHPNKDNICVNCDVRGVIDAYKELGINCFEIDDSEEEKHFHITLGGTYSVKAKSLKKAIKEVESWFDNCGVHVFAEETDDNMHCDYCCD